MWTWETFYHDFNYNNIQKSWNLCILSCINIQCSIRDIQQFFFSGYISIYISYFFLSKHKKYFHGKEVFFFQLSKTDEFSLCTSSILSARVELRYGLNCSWSFNNFHFFSFLLRFSPLIYFRSRWTHSTGWLFMNLVPEEYGQ